MVHFTPIVLIGAVLGLFPIILGIVGLVTPNWLNIVIAADESNSVYGLFRRCNTATVDNTTLTMCEDVPTFTLIQGLQIAGVVIIAVGIIGAVILKLLLPISNLNLISPLLPMIGSILILIGSLLYAKYVIENYTISLIEVDIGCSLILMVIVCIFGFLATTHFSFSAGYIYRHNRPSIILI